MGYPTQRGRVGFQCCSFGPAAPEQMYLIWNKYCKSIPESKLELFDWDFDFNHCSAERSCQTTYLSWPPSCMTQTMSCKALPERPKVRITWSRGSPGCELGNVCQLHNSYLYAAHCPPLLLATILSLSATSLLPKHMYYARQFEHLRR